MSRVGNFTSSQMYRLMSKGRGNWSLENTGKPYESYIKEKLREVRTGRPIQTSSSAKPTEWGHFMEKWVFDEKLGWDYALISKKRFQHPELPWSGMPDLIKEKSIGDIKNPWTINSFCDLADSIKEGSEALKKTHPEYYWQLVSNAILCKVSKVELIVHVPYKDELEAIREATNMFDGDLNKIAFINWANDEDLPYLLRDKYYKDLNTIEFEVPKEDIKLLTERVKMSTNELNRLLK